MPWPAEKIEILKTLYLEGKRIKTICEETGMSDGYVRWKVRDLGLIRPSVDFWNAERVGVLKAMWANGDTAQVIADAIGATRNSVLGKVHRLRLPTRSDTKPARAECWSGKRRSKPEPKPRQRQNRISAPKLIAAPPTRESLSSFDAKIPRERLKQVWEIGPKECRWPIGDPGENGFGFCCAATDGATYCAEHTYFAYARVKEGPRHRRHAFGSLGGVNG